MPDAIIFVPATDPHMRHWVRVCFSHCLKLGYSPLAVVHRWEDVLEMVFEEGLRPVIVIARRDHLDPKREPRLEVVTEERERAPGQRQRRPHRTDSEAA